MSLQPGDRVDYQGDHGTPPKPATVVGLLGSIWARLKCDDGELVEQARIATTPGNSPLGNFCLPRN